MERFLKYMESQQIRRIDGGGFSIDDKSLGTIHFAIDPKQLDVRVSSRDGASKLVVIRSGESGAVKVELEQGAKVDILEVLYDGAVSDMTIAQGATSQLGLTTLQLESSIARSVVNLDGEGAECDVNVLQLPSEEMVVSMDLRISHNISNCRSRSLSKCVASGSSRGEFSGLVYVAQDAQQTIAEQNSRNIALSDSAQIKAEPQLEIYADDVKCSHGATVGQMNDETIYYMRQRGLSEEQARKLQLEGYVGEVVDRCGVVELVEALHEVVNDRLAKL